MNGQQHGWVHSVFPIPATHLASRWLAHQADHIVPPPSLQAVTILHTTTTAALHRLCMNHKQLRSLVYREAAAGVYTDKALQWFHLHNYSFTT
jgi:hypothetical protein